MTKFANSSALLALLLSMSSRLPLESRYTTYHPARGRPGGGVAGAPPRCDVGTGARVSTAKIVNDWDVYAPPRKGRGGPPCSPPALPPPSLAAAHQVLLGRRRTQCRAISVHAPSHFWRCAVRCSGLQPRARPPPPCARPCRWTTPRVVACASAQAFPHRRLTEAAVHRSPPRAARHQEL